MLHSRREVKRFLSPTRREARSRKTCTIHRVVYRSHSPTRVKAKHGKIKILTGELGTKFTVDTGATIHCVNKRELLETEYTGHRPIRVKVANKQILEAEAVGSSRVTFMNEHGNLHEYVFFFSVVVTRR